jgi:hypothetical protein
LSEEPAASLPIHNVTTNMSNPIQLYSLATPNGQKIAIALEEMGLPYEAHTINIVKGEQFNPDFLKISPNNKIVCGLRVWCEVFDNIIQLHLLLLQEVAAVLNVICNPQPAIVDPDGPEGEITVSRSPVVVLKEQRSLASPELRFA